MSSWLVLRSATSAILGCTQHGMWHLGTQSVSKGGGGGDGVGLLILEVFSNLNDSMIL